MRLYPNTSQAQRRKAEGQFTDAPFLSAAKVFELPQAPDFVGTGDFDANGHQDLIVASRGSNALFILEGNGQAGFGATKRIELPGAVTALATGEMNRADGLEDIVVGILAAGGPKALVYESLEGASRATPEAFNLSAEATALALGKLDDDHLMDFAVAAGKDALVVYGRDNKAKQARSSKRRFASAVRSITIGSFIDKDKPSLAVLTGDGALHLLGQSEAKKKKERSDKSMEGSIFSSKRAFGRTRASAPVVCPDRQPRSDRFNRSSNADHRRRPVCSESEQSKFRNCFSQSCGV